MPRRDGVGGAAPRRMCHALRTGEDVHFSAEHDAISRLSEESTRTWIDIEASTEGETTSLASTFVFHRRALLDLLNNAVRPEQETYGSVLFTVLGIIKLNPGEIAPDTIHLNFFLTPQCLSSAHAKPLKTTRIVDAELLRGPNLLLGGTYHLYYRLLEGVVNPYLDILDEMEVQFEELECMDFKNNDATVQSLILSEKWRIAYLKRFVTTKCDALRELVYRNFEELSPETQVHPRDVLDHVMRVDDGIESCRELAAGLMASYTSQIANCMHEEMKLMSVIATIMLPLSFLTGLSGRNFYVVPGVHVEYRFWVLWCAVVWGCSSSSCFGSFGGVEFYNRVIVVAVATPRKCTL